MHADAAAGGTSEGRQPTVDFHRAHVCHAYAGDRAPAQDRAISHANRAYEVFGRHSRQKLLVSFLDELQIPNQDGLIAEDHELGPVAAAALEPAVRRLRDQFDGAEVEIYLASLLALDPEVWGGLGELLREDRDAHESPTALESDPG